MLTIEPPPESFIAHGLTHDEFFHRRLEKRKLADDLRAVDHRVETAVSRHDALRIGDVDLDRDEIAVCERLHRGCGVGYDDDLLVQFAGAFVHRFCLSVTLASG